MLALLLAAVLYQEPEKQKRPEDERPTLQERIEAGRQAAIAAAKEHLAERERWLKFIKTEKAREKRATRRGKRYRARTHAALDVPAYTRQVAVAKKTLADLESNQPPFQLLLTSRPTVGDVGVYPEGHRVSQVIDDDEMLVEFTVGTRFIADPTTRESRFLTRATGRSEPIRRLMWVQGLPTTELADGDVLPYSGYFEVTGNRQYETALGGTKTVHVLEPIE